MARLIDADELLESIEETTWYHVFKGKLIHGANSKTDIPLYKASDIYSVLDAAPTIDAVPVVRCDKCIMHNNCTTEDAFKLCGIEDPFCCAGKRDEPVKPPEEADSFLMNRFLKVE